MQKIPFARAVLKGVFSKATALYAFTPLVLGLLAGYGTGHSGLNFFGFKHSANRSLASVNAFTGGPGVRGCPSGTTAAFITMTTQTPLDQSDPTKLAPEADPAESYLTCFRKGADGKVSNILFVRREMSLNFVSDQPMAEFAESGFTLNQKSAPHFRVSVLKCEKCDLNSAGAQNLSQAILHNVNLVLKKDYRKIEYTVDTAKANPEMLYKGSPFHVLTFEIGSRGVLRVRFSRCDSADSSCLESPNGHLQKIEDIDLGDVERVNP